MSYNLLQEAEQDHLFEKRVNIFKKILPSIIWATVISVIVFAFYNWNNSRIQALRAERMSLFNKAIVSSDMKLSNEALEELQKNDDAVAWLSAFELTNRLVAKGSSEEAIINLEKLLSRNFSESIKSLAKLQILAITIDKKDLSPLDKERGKKYADACASKGFAFSSGIIYASEFYRMIGDEKKSKEFFELYNNGK